MRVKILRTVKVKLADIKVNLFVRKELDVDHVMYLAELIEAGVKMNSRMMVTEDLLLVEGRHRKAAFELARSTEEEVDIVRKMDDIELISEAYRANTGGSKPPTIADTEHTIMLLLDKGESMKSIGDLLGLPASLARKYATEVKSRMTRAKYQRAVDSIAEGGLTVAKASELHGVDAEKLREVLSGQKRKVKQNGISDLHRSLTNLYRGIGQKNASAMRKLIDKYEDGDVSKKQVDEIFDHIDQLMKRSSKSASEWRTRFNATVTGTKVAKSA